MKTINKKQDNANEQVDENPIFYDIDELINKGEFDGALKLLDTIPENAPEYQKALLLKSVILAMLGDYDGAAENIQKSLDLDKQLDLKKYRPIDINDPEDLFNCGLTNFYFGDYRKAIAYFNQSLELLPNQSEVIYYKSLTFACLEDFEKAIDLMDEAIKINPTDNRFWNDKGAFLSELNHVDKAHECFDTSIRLNENSYNWSNKGVLYHKHEEFEKSLQCYDNAIKLDENDIYPIIGKAKVYMELEDFTNAEECFQIAEEIDDADLEYLIERGKYFIFKKEYINALKLFDRALKIDNTQSFVWMFKAMALKKLNRFFKAEKCVEKAVSLDPDIISQFDEFFADD